MKPFILYIDPAEDLILQLQQSLKSHPAMQVQLTAEQIRELLPQAIHQVLSDKLIRSYIDGVFLKNIEIEIEESILSFSVQAVLDFVGPAAFLGRNKLAIITGRIGMKQENAQLTRLDIDIPNLGFFQKGLFGTAKSSIIHTVMQTDLEEAFVLALQKEKISVAHTQLRVYAEKIMITMTRDNLSK